MQYCQYVTGGGVDYDSGPYTVTFSAGQTSVPFDVPINNDNICEGNEVFDVTIDPSSTPSFVTVGSPDQATVTIVDDECKQSCIKMLAKQNSVVCIQ